MPVKPLRKTFLKSVYPKPCGAWQSRACTGKNAATMYNRGVANSRIPSTDIAQPARPWQRLLAWAALAAATVYAASLGWRPLGSPDLGYHLAYGDFFLDHHRIVDSNEFIY